MTQLVFDWPARISYAAADFISSPANQEAFEFLARWPEQNPTASVALLQGAKGCGKTHLASVWRERTQATVISPDAFGKVPSEYWWQQHNAALLEDIEHITDEKNFFHLLRHAESHKRTLLLTSAVSSIDLSFSLPDLCSRIRALPNVALLPPDDTLLHFFCLKICSDYQVRVADEVIAYLIKRSERSFLSLHDILTNLIRTSMIEKREITIPWVRSVLTII